MNLITLLEQFPDNESCRQHLIQVRWPNGVTCPRCQCARVSVVAKRKQWTCLGCRYRFSATVGTIFHQSHIGLRKWFIAIFILLNAKKSKSSLEMNRELGVSQECCWHMCHRIREAMREGDSNLFKGIVQMDEHWTGGLPRKGVWRPARGGDGRGTKRPIVVGAVEVSTGRVKTQHVQDVRKHTMIEFAEKHMDLSQVDLHTDQCKSYIQLGRMCRSHGVIDHDDWFVSETGVTTNCAENAWSLFSRAVMGSFHRLSRKHLHRYLSEFDSRFNARREPMNLFFQRTLTQGSGRRLSRRQLVG